MVKDVDGVVREVVSASSPANDTAFVADNEGMVTQTFDVELFPLPGEIATSASADGLSEDTLKEPPEDLQESFPTDVPTEDGEMVAELESLSEAEPVLVAEEESVIEDIPAPDPLPAIPVEAPEYSRIAICSQTNGRANNEDSYFVQTMPTGATGTAVQILALSDGMGGHDFGEHASREALRKLALLLFEQYAVLPQLNGRGTPPTAEEIGKAMVQAAPLVSGHVARIAEINGWNRSGATLVATAVVENTAVFMNVGDSPAYHVRPATGTVTPMTDDHSLAGMLLKAQLITADMARVHEGRCQLEHYIGGPELPHEMPVRTVELLPGDFIVLCSDGVSNSLNDETILTLLTDVEKHLTERAAGFVVHGRLAGEHDNQTIVLYQHGVQAQVAAVDVIPDAGPLSAQPMETGDNVPAPVHTIVAETEAAA